MRAYLRPAVTLLAGLTILTGVAYPALVTGLSQALFPDRAAGSFVMQNGAAVGSRLIGQPFSDVGHFRGRPSATTPTPYNAAASGGSDLGPSNPLLADSFSARAERLRAADPSNTAPIPVDLLTASASGLDPDISPAAAAYQAPRVARLRGIAMDTLQQIVAAHTTGRFLGLFGEPRVNVLLLNLALDSAVVARSTR